MYLNTLKLLSTLNLGFKTPVKNYLPHGEKVHVTAVYDLNNPIFFFIIAFHISISPFRFPNPPKATNLDDGLQITLFLWCLPNSYNGLQLLSNNTEQAGI